METWSIGHAMNSAVTMKHAFKVYMWAKSHDIVNFGIKSTELASSPRPLPCFLHAALKTSEWPGDKATQIDSHNIIYS